MTSKYYKNYRTCSICGNEYPLTREYFKRNTLHSVERFHHKCRSCETEEYVKSEWRDGNLLCHKCGLFKPEDCFSKNGKSCEARNNRKRVCKKCASKRQREIDLGLQSDEKLKKCLRFRFLGARGRAIRNNIPFNLELNDVINLWEAQDGLCALSGLPMTFELRRGRIPTNVSIDKIDSRLGYVRGNVQLVCMACNQIKSDLTDIEMYNFCKNIVKCYESKNNINS